MHGHIINIAVFYLYRKLANRKLKDEIIIEGLRPELTLFSVSNIIVVYSHHERYRCQYF